MSPRHLAALAALAVLTALGGLAAMTTIPAVEPTTTTTADDVPTARPSAARLPEAPADGAGGFRMPENLTGDYQAMIDWCETAQVPLGGVCAYKYFSDYTAQHGFADAVELVEQLKVTDRTFIPDCHHAYHGVGQLALVEAGVTDALEASTMACQSGFLHGVLQAWTLETDADTFEAQFRTVCDVFEEPDQRKAFCGHGVGHAVALHTPHSIIESVDRCGQIEGTVAVACMEGAIMEFGGLDHVTVEIKESLGATPADSLTDSQRETLCLQIPDRFGDRCWMRVFQLWSDIWDDTDEYVRRCSQAPTDDRRDRCLSTIGELAYGRSMPIMVSSGPEELNAMFAKCDVLSESDRPACWTGIVESLWRDEPLDGAPVDTICPSLPAEIRPTCQTAERAALEYRKAA